MSLRKVSDLRPLELSGADFQEAKLSCSLVELSYRSIQDKKRHYDSVGMNFKDFSRAAYTVVSPYKKFEDELDPLFKFLQTRTNMLLENMSWIKVERWKIYLNGGRQPIEKQVLVQMNRNLTMTNCTVSLSPSQYYYVDANAVTSYCLFPSVAVFSPGGNQLTEGVDYSVSYLDNSIQFSHTVQGELTGYGHVSLAGLNYYSGTKTAQFEVVHEYYVPQKYDLSTAASMTLTPETCAVVDFESSHTFTDVCPVPEVIMLVRSELSTLVLGQDYTVSYSNNSGVLAHDDYGELDFQAQATFIGKGNFTGTVVREYTISHTYARKPSAYFSITNSDAKTVAQVISSYNMPDNVTWNISCVAFSTAADEFWSYAASIKNLSPEYVSNLRVIAVSDVPSSGQRSYVVMLSSSYDGEDAGGNAAVAVAISKATSQVSLDDADFELTPAYVAFSGAQTPYTYTNARPDSVTVICNQETLTQDQDYLVSYVDDSGQFVPTEYEYNTYTNYASVIVEGVNVYSGSISATYPITYTYHAPIPQYTVTLVVNPSSGGTVTGGGTYDENSVIIIEATAKAGYTFFGWIKEDCKVITMQQYRLTVTKDITLTAQFNS